MCMTIKKTEIADKNIPVYVIRRFHNKKVLSPFRLDFEWRIRKAYIVEEGNVKFKKPRLKNKVLDCGAFHCLLSFNNAERFINDIRIGEKRGTYRIYKAIIPKGTYIAYGVIPNGIIGYGMGCIGTRQLKITKNVEEYELKYAYSPLWSWDSYRTSPHAYSTSTPTGYVYNTGSTT